MSDEPTQEELPLEPDEEREVETPDPDEAPEVPHDEGEVPEGA